MHQVGFGFDLDRGCKQKLITRFRQKRYRVTTQDNTPTDVF